LASERQGDFDAALADLNRAVELLPRSASTHAARSRLRYWANDLDGAVADASQAIALDTNTPSAYGTRAWARYGKGNVSGAIQDCQAAIRLLQTDAPGLAVEQGLLNFIRGEYEPAIASWQQAIQDNPQLQAKTPALD